MINANSIEEIISLYNRHGWTLRHLLLTAELEKQLGLSQIDRFDGVDQRRSDIDGAWFSRSSSDGRETWELRLLGSTPFALLDVLDGDMDEIEREKALTRIEAKMLEFKSRNHSGN